MTLSKDRAATVEKHLINLGVSASRITTNGFGESLPKVTNDTPEGRTQNRRVEIGIVANEKMQEEAKKGEIKGNRP